jgi:hypothetical protein
MTEYITFNQVGYMLILETIYTKLLRTVLKLAM